MFKPMGNRVLMQRDGINGDLQTAAGLFIPEFAQEKPQTATVIAIGSKVVDVKPGDVVLLGKYSGYEVSLEGKALTLVPDTDIMGVLNAG